MDCYDCGKSANISGKDRHYYCEMCWNGTMAKEETICKLLVVAIRKLLVENIDVINRRCAPYQKGVNTQDKGINKNFQNLVADASRSVLTDMGYQYKSAILDIISDVSLETDDFILQVDAKGCHVNDGDFRIDKESCFRGHCGIAQTSLTSTAMFKNRATGEEFEQRGLQKSEIDGKPVYTIIVFMRWGYSDKYFIESCGVVNLPHISEKIHKFKVGKSKDEMRWVLKDSTLFQVHQFSSE